MQPLPFTHDHDLCTGKEEIHTRSGTAIRKRELAEVHEQNLGVLPLCAEGMMEFDASVVPIQSKRICMYSAM